MTRTITTATNCGPTTEPDAAESNGEPDLDAEEPTRRITVRLKLEAPPTSAVVPLGDNKATARLTAVQSRDLVRRSFDDEPDDDEPGEPYVPDVPDVPHAPAVPDAPHVPDLGVPPPRSSRPSAPAAALTGATSTSYLQLGAPVSSWRPHITPAAVRAAEEIRNSQITLRSARARTGSWIVPTIWAIAITLIVALVMLAIFG